MKNCIRQTLWMLPLKQTMKRRNQMKSWIAVAAAVLAIIQTIVENILSIFSINCKTVSKCSKPCLIKIIMMLGRCMHIADKKTIWSIHTQMLRLPPRKHSFHKAWMKRVPNKVMVVLLLYLALAVLVLVCRLQIRLTICFSRTQPWQTCLVYTSDFLHSWMRRRKLF